MPLPLATFLTALVAEINDAGNQTALGQALPAAWAYQDSADTTERATLAATVTPFSWTPLGRAGGLSLDQHIVQITLARQAGTAATANITADLLTANILRGLLLDFEDATSAGRVVNILGPQVVERDRLITPGQVAVRLLLDCDFLAGMATTDTEPETPGRLTVARNGVWDAIHAWPALLVDEESLFAREYQSSADFAELQLRDPAPHELPALALYWGEIKPEWRTNRQQEWPLALRLSAWFPGDRHTWAETVLEEVFNAIYQGTEDGQTVPAIQRATGYPPRRITDLTIQTVTLGRAQQVHALRADVAFALRSNIDPFGND